MKLLLPPPVIKRFKRKLRGRINEIGGVIVGEHVSPDAFRVVDVSIQKHGGTIAHFVRDPAQHKAFLLNFFAKTGNDYSRFNYLGEWHSHPTFDPLPSEKDIATMHELVEDPTTGVNFAVLMIVRLKGWRTLELSALLFRAGMMPEGVSVEADDEPLDVVTQNPLKRFLALFRQESRLRSLAQTKGSARYTAEPARTPHKLMGYRRPRY
jgi:proteasome lid subunit RPN8/RPN11